jgi:hypothetical protein
MHTRYVVILGRNKQNSLLQTPIFSLASTQSALLSHQVYLTDRIDNAKRDRMPHMKCVCFLRPSDDSFDALVAELREPKYGEYYLCQSVNLFGDRARFSPDVGCSFS